MKQFFLILTLVLLSAAEVFAQSKFYTACQEKSDKFETVFIGKAMLRMVGQSKMNVNNMNFGAVVNKINSISIITAEEKKNVAELEKIAKSFFSQATGFELLMDVTEDGEHVKILGRENVNSENTYVLLTTESQEMTVIEMTGTLTADDIQRLKNTNKK